MHKMIKLLDKKQAILREIIKYNKLTSYGASSYNTYELEILKKNVESLHKSLDLIDRLIKREEENEKNRSSKMR